MDGNATMDRLLAAGAMPNNLSDERTGSRTTGRSGTVGQEVPEEHAIEIEPSGPADLPYEEDEHIAGEPIKLLVAFIFLICGLFTSVVSLAMTHDRVPDYKPLPDIFLNNLPYQPWGLAASEYIIVVSTWTAALVVLFHKHRTIVARRVCLLVGLHYFYRAVTFFVTVLPKPDENFYCSPKANTTTILIILERAFKLASGFGLAINGNYVYCGDYIYSGHTTILISCYLIIQEYSPKRWFVLHYTFFCTSTLGIIFLLLNRGHYTIDCIIAYWVTTRVWWMFHTLANNEQMKEVEYSTTNLYHNNYLKRAWWWHIFRYFEKNVPTNLPLEHSWPIPQRVKDTSAFQYITRRFGSENNDDSLSESLLPSRAATRYASIPNRSSQGE